MQHEAGIIADDAPTLVPLCRAGGERYPSRRGEVRSDAAVEIYAKVSSSGSPRSRRTESRTRGDLRIRSLARQMLLRYVVGCDGTGSAIVPLERCEGHSR